MLVEEPKVKLLNPNDGTAMFAGTTFEMPPTGVLAQGVTKPRELRLTPAPPMVDPSVPVTRVYTTRTSLTMVLLKVVVRPKSANMVSPIFPCAKPGTDCGLTELNLSLK